MRILYVAAGTPVPGTHGGSVHAQEICRALARRGHEVHLAAMRGPGSAPAAIVVHPLRRLLPITLLEWTAAPQLVRLARALRPDVLIERFYTFAGGGLWAAHRLGIPAVLEVNSPARVYPGSLRDRLDALTWFRPIDRWRRAQLRWADAIYATAAQLLPPERQASVRVVVNGVDAERFVPAARPEPAAALRLVFVGSFHSWHGAEDLIAATAECVARGIDVVVTCIGEGPRFAAARRAAERAALGERMRFLGRVAHDEVPTHLRGADIGVAPFHPAAHRALELGWFWSPIKIFEYLASGLGVVTIDIRELRELLPDTVARFYRPGAPRALAEVIAGLARDRAEVARMGETARRLAVERYSWDRQAEIVEEVLDTAVGCARRRAGGLAKP